MEHPRAAGAAAPDRSLTTVVYGLQALYFVSGVAMLAAAAINYWKRDEVRGTWLESHSRWQMDTFRGFVAALVTVLVLASVAMALDGRGSGLNLGSGFVLAVGGAMVVLHGWYAYRVARGWVRLRRAEAMP